MIVARVQLLFAAVIFGWTFVATKICLTRLTPVELLGARFLIALPVLYGLMRFKGVKPGWPGWALPQRRWKELGAGAVLFCFHFLIQVTGMQYTSATNTGWIVTVAPLAIAVLAHWILKERLTKRILIGIGVSSAGILSLVSRGDFGSLAWLTSIGDWLILVSAFTWALFTILIRDVSRTESPLLVTFSMVLPAAVVAVGLAALRSGFGTFSNLPVEIILSLVFLGVVATAIAHWFFQEGLARVGATEAGMYLFIEPVATMALAVPYLGEPYGLAVIVGGVLVLGGVFLAQLR